MGSGKKLVDLFEKFLSGILWTMIGGSTIWGLLEGRIAEAWTRSPQGVSAVAALAFALGVVAGMYLVRRFEVTPLEVRYEAEATDLRVSHAAEVEKMMADHAAEVEKLMAPQRKMVTTLRGLSEIDRGTVREVYEKGYKIYELEVGETVADDYLVVLGVVVAQEWADNFNDFRHAMYKLAPEARLAIDEDHSLVGLQ